MKYLIAVAVTLLIIVIPFGSWYYLQTGLNYRKESLSKLEPKGLISDISKATIFKGKTSIVYDANKDASKRQDMEVVYDQFEGSNTFQLVEVNNGSTTRFGSSHVIVTDSIWKAGHENESYITLIDTAGQIRNYYLDMNDAIKKCVEHLALIMPIPKRKDIKMKSGKDYDAKPSFMKREKGNESK